MKEIVNRATGEFIPIIVDKGNGELAVAKEACEVIATFERQMKSIRDQYDEYKRALLEAMEEYEVKKIDTEDFTVTYIAPTERISLDSKKVEKEHPEVYRECMRVSDVRSSVRVKLKG